jgi:hypothetical protein
MDTDYFTSSGSDEELNPSSDVESEENESGPDFFPDEESEENESEDVKSSLTKPKWENLSSDSFSSDSPSEKKSGPDLFPSDSTSELGTYHRNFYNSSDEESDEIYAENCDDSMSSSSCEEQEIEQEIKCCNNNCFGKFGNSIEEICSVVRRCVFSFDEYVFFSITVSVTYIFCHSLFLSFRTKYFLMKKAEKYDDIVKTISHSITSVKSSGNVSLNFHIFMTDKDKKSKSVTVCREGFRILADISHATFQRMVAITKNGSTSSTKVSDTSVVRVNKDSLKNLALLFNVKLTDKQLASINIPTRSTTAKVCAAWLDKFFSLASCVNPVNGNIEIEICSKMEVYEMYKAEILLYKTDSILSQTRFNALLRAVFPFIHIRKKKSVTGKCQVCAHLSYLRQQAKSSGEIDIVAQFHAIHKVGFMGERGTYYSTRFLGLTDPKNHASLITDGMTQSHCILPWLKGKNQPVMLPQHLQGTFVHGRSIYIYRTFHNVKVASLQFVLL